MTSRNECKLTAGVPPARSPSWEEPAEDLLAFVKTRGGATVDDVAAWGAGRELTAHYSKHVLAWLSFHGLVHYDEFSGRWVPGPEPPQVFRSVAPEEAGEEHERPPSTRSRRALLRRMAARTKQAGRSP